MEKDEYIDFFLSLISHLLLLLPKCFIFKLVPAEKTCMNVKFMVFSDSLSDKTQYLLLTSYDSWAIKLFWQPRNTNIIFFIRDSLHYRQLTLTLSSLFMSLWSI